MFDVGSRAGEEERKYVPFQEDIRVEGIRPI
jgi:hypothetical protein